MVTLWIVSRPSTETQERLRERLAEAFDTFAFVLELKRRALALRHPAWSPAEIETELERWVRSDEP